VAFFTRLVIQPAIASLIDSRACSRVSPSERQPGSSGHSITKCPSSSFSQRIVSFMMIRKMMNFFVLSYFQSNKHLCLNRKDPISIRSKEQAIIGMYLPRNLIRKGIWHLRVSPLEEFMQRRDAGRQGQE